MVGNNVNSDQVQHSAQACLSRTLNYILYVTSVQPGQPIHLRSLVRSYSVPFWILQYPLIILINHRSRHAGSGFSIPKYDILKSYFLSQCIILQTSLVICCLQMSLYSFPTFSIVNIINLIGKKKWTYRVSNTVSKKSLLFHEKQIIRH